MPSDSNPPTTASTATSICTSVPNVPAFLRSAFDMITACPPYICCWDEETKGTTFTVYEPDKLGAEILPKYFKTNRYSSFMKNLNTYQFRKMSMEQPSGVIWHRYEHVGFVKGQPEKLVMVRSRKKLDLQKQKSRQELVKENEAIKAENRKLSNENGALKAGNASLALNVQTLQMEMQTLRLQLLSIIKANSHTNGTGEGCHYKRRRIDFNENESSISRGKKPRGILPGQSNSSDYDPIPVFLPLAKDIPRRVTRSLSESLEEQREQGFVSFEDGGGSPITSANVISRSKSPTSEYMLSKPTPMALRSRSEEFCFVSLMQMLSDDN